MVNQKITVIIKGVYMLISYTNKTELKNDLCVYADGLVHLVSVDQVEQLKNAINKADMVSLSNVGNEFTLSQSLPMEWVTSDNFQCNDNYVSTLITVINNL